MWNTRYQFDGVGYIWWIGVGFFDMLMISLCEGFSWKQELTGVPCLGRLFSNLEASLPGLGKRIH
jgi:hypothetical protein